MKRIIDFAPESWSEIMLIDCFRTNIGGANILSSEYADEGVPVILKSDVQPMCNTALPEKFVTLKVVKSKYDSKTLVPGDLLLCMRDLSQKAQILGLVTSCEDRQSGYLVAQGVTILRGCKIERKFISYFSNSTQYREYIFKVKRGSTQVHLGNSDVFELALPLPPLDEQKRIVAKIESTHEKIKVIEDSVTKAEELIEKYREALLQKAFRGELVKQDPNDEPASKLLERIRAERAQASDSKKKKKDDLPPIKPEEIPFKIPKSWEWVPFESVVTIDAPLVSPKDYLDSIHIAPNHIESNTGRLFGYGTVREDKVTSNKYLFSKNTVLYSKIRPHLNKAAYVEFDGVCSADMYPLNSALDPKFLLNYILSKIFLNYAVQSNERVLLPKINREELANIPVPVPPQSEQKRIVEALESKFSSLDSLKQKLKDLNAKKQSLGSSILCSAFSGHLVPQILQEGTGHELLSQITEKKTEPKTEKSSNPSPKKVRKKK